MLAVCGFPFTHTLFIAMLCMGVLLSCGGDQNEPTPPPAPTPTNNPPTAKVPEKMTFDRKNNPTTDILTTELLKYITDDYTPKEKLKITITPQVDFTKEGETHIKGTVADNGSNSK